MSTAISGYSTTLYCGETEGTYTKLVDIKDVPDLISDPNLLDATTLSDPMQVQIFGILQADTKSFTANYNKADYESVSKLGYDESSDANTDKYYALKMQDGSGFTWTGMHQVGLSGFGVDEVAEMTINCVFHSKPKFSKSLTI
jgi:hypothetical protein